MADLKISELTAITEADLAGADLVPVVDTTATETKSILVSELDKRWAPINGAISIVSPTTLNTTNVDVNQLAYYRHDQFMIGEGVITWNGAGSGGTWSVTLPDGAVADTTYLAGGSTVTIAGASTLGLCTFHNSGTSTFHGITQLLTTTTLQFYTSVALTGAIFANGDGLKYTFKVPVVGWD